jgi:hypothetical protein
MWRPTSRCHSRRGYTFGLAGRRTRAFGSWTLDGAAGVWLFTPKDAYYPGV